MGVGSEIRWSGQGFLSQVAGPSSEASPVRALYLAHRVSASGRLWMSRGVEVCSIILAEGSIAGCSGFRELISGIEGERQWSVSEWAEAAEASDTEGIEALTRVARNLCGAALQIEADGDWMVNFIVADEPAPVDAPISEDLAASLQAAIGAAFTDADVRSWIAGATNTKVDVWRPDDCSTEQLGLTAESLRLLDACEANGEVGSLYVEIGVGGWSSFGILWRLGFVFIADQAERSDTVEEGVPEPPAEPVEPAKKETSPAAQEVSPPKAAPSSAPSSQSASAPAEPSPPAASKRPTRAASGQSRERSGGAKQGKRKRDPRRTTLQRSPSESPPDMMEAHLKEAYDVLSKVSPEFVFRLRKTEDLDMRIVEQRYHKAASRYHPDRYRSASQGIKSLAEGCFTAVADSFHKLKDATYMENLKNRLIEKETGKKVVTEKTRAKATVDHAKADVLFRQKKFSDAERYAARAVEGDPDKWQYQYLKIRCSYRSGAMTLAELEPEFLGLQGMTTVEKAEQLYILGEMFLRENDDTRAFKLFRQALSLDEQNVGANRRVRLRDRRKREDENKSSGGLFGGLFKGRKG